MTTRKIQKLIYNIFVICLLLGAIIYVCSRFIHLGVEYTDNAQVKQHIIFNLFFCSSCSIFTFHRYTSNSL